MHKLTPEQKVAAAREELAVDQPFYGVLIFGMPTVPATRVYGQPIRTMATDGTTIWYNPGFVDGLALPEVKGVLMHEVMHKANAHHLRRNGRPHSIWNKACDYAINPLVTADGQILPSGALINPQFADWSAEEIYEQLVLPPPPPPPPVGGTPCDDGEPGPGGKGDDNKSDDADEDEDGKPEPKPKRKDDGDTSPDEDDEVEAGTGSDHGLILDPVDEDGRPLSPADIEAQLAQVQVEVIQAATVAHAAGLLPAGLERLVEEAKSPREDWREVLRRFVAQSCETPVDQTWARVNRRFVGAGTYLPGWRKEDTEDLLVVIDSSGSTFTTPALPRFYTELNRIVEDVRPGRVTVLVWDTQVQACNTYLQGEAIPHLCPGGGGTRFEGIWPYVDTLPIKPAGCVFFTDLECWSWGNAPSYPVLWAKWGYSRKVPPFGEVLDINAP